MENPASSMRDRKVIIAAHMYVLESFKCEICEKQCIKNNAISKNKHLTFKSSFISSTIIKSINTTVNELYVITNDMIVFTLYSSM